jgi:subtilase family serine protease
LVDARRRGPLAVAAATTLLLAFSCVAAPGASAASAPPPTPAPFTSAQCLRLARVNCYSPRQVERAYDLGPLYAQGLDGRGSTIVIVDPFGSPTIGHDLHAFDEALGLRDPPALRVIQPVGAVPPYDPFAHTAVSWKLSLRLTLPSRNENT